MYVIIRLDNIMANVPDCKSCNGGSSPPLTLAYLSHYAYAPGSTAT